MEPVLLGLAASSAVGEAGNLVERTLRAAAEPFAAVLHAVAATLSSNAEGSESTSVDIDDLRSRLEKLPSELASRIEQVLASAGVEFGRPIALRVSEIDGRIEVVGNHRQKALIESALADDDELAGEFSEMITLMQLFAVADEVDEVADTVELGQAEQETAIAIFSTDSEGPQLKIG